MKRRSFLSTIAALVTAPFLPKARTGSVLADQILGPPPSDTREEKFTMHWSYYDGDKFIETDAVGFHNMIDLSEKKNWFPATH